MRLSLIDTGFSTAREQEIKQIESEFELWKKGNFASTVVIGERGTGVTTLLDQAERDIFAENLVVRVNLESSAVIDQQKLFDTLLAAFQESIPDIQCQTFEEFVDEINALEQECIVIIENLTNLYVRTTDGFETLEDFLMIMVQTQESVHWVVSCSLYGWRYLDKVLNMNKYMQRVIELKPLSKTAVSDIILLRHRVSNYQLRFLPTAEIENNKTYQQLNTEKEKQAYLQDHFFCAINGLSGRKYQKCHVFLAALLCKI